MKNIYLLTFVCMALYACNDDKAQEKKLMDDILATHEKVMAAEDKAVNNKMHLDSLLKMDQFQPKDSATLKAEFKVQSAKLTAADDAMSDWMHKFDPDYKGKSHADIMDYLSRQRTQINKVDTQLSEAIDQSGKALSKYKK